MVNVGVAFNDTGASSRFAVQTVVFPEGLANQIPTEKPEPYLQNPNSNRPEDECHELGCLEGDSEEPTLIDFGWRW